MHICNRAAEILSIKDVDVPSIPYPDGFVFEDTNYVMKGLCPGGA